MASRPPMASRPKPRPPPPSRGSVRRSSGASNTNTTSTRRLNLPDRQDSIDYSKDITTMKVQIEVRIEDESRWESQAVFDFWKKKQNRELIVNAVPIAEFPSRVESAELVSTERPTPPQKVFRPLLKRLIRRDTTGSSKLSQIPHNEHMPTSGIAGPAGYSCGGHAGVSAGYSRAGTAGNAGNANKRELQFQKVSTHGCEPISETQLITPPYKNIGMIFWVKPDDPYHELRIPYATGFYIGNDTVVTVAHYFEGSESLHNKIDSLTPVFVPAMVNKKDIEGKFFGIFILDDIYIHTMFSCVDYSYDICIAKIICGSESTRPLTGPGLQLTNNSQLQGGTFKVIGYRRFDQVIGSEKMVEFPGTFHSKDNENVNIKPAAYCGMSGGPWIQEDDKVVGIQSAREPISKLPEISCSPILSDETLGNIATVQQIYDENIQTEQGMWSFQFYETEKKKIHFIS